MNIHVQYQAMKKQVQSCSVIEDGQAMNRSRNLSDLDTAVLLLLKTYKQSSWLQN